MRHLRETLSYLYSANHLAHFFYQALRHFSITIKQPFDFIAASRSTQLNMVDHDVHLRDFLSLDSVPNIHGRAVAMYISLSILLDAYPPRMHRKPIFILDKKALLTPHRI